MSIRVLSLTEALTLPDPVEHRFRRNQYGRLVIAAGLGRREIALVLDEEAERDLKLAMAERHRLWVAERHREPPELDPDPYLPDDPF